MAFPPRWISYFSVIRVTGDEDKTSDLKFVVSEAESRIYGVTRCFIETNWRESNEKWNSKDIFFQNSKAI